MGEEELEFPEEEFQAMADDSIQSLRDSIVTEDQIIQEEHSLSDKLNSWDGALGYLVQNVITAEQKDLLTLVTQVEEKLIELREFEEAEMQVRLVIEKEERANLEKLQAAVAHREWKIVKALRKEEKKEEKKAIRASKEEIKTIHKKFLEIMKIIKRSKHFKLGVVTKAQEPGEDKVQHYLTELYKFLRAYEQVLRKLWEKEKIHLK